MPGSGLDGEVGTRQIPGFSRKEGSGEAGPETKPSNPIFPTVKKFPQNEGEVKECELKREKSKQ